MKRFLCYAVIALLCCCIISAKVYAQQEQTQQQREKNVMIANINALRNQELKVAVLQQIFNEEMAKLMQMQAVFCDQYKLDLHKFRSGLYQYDEREGKFVERKPEIEEPQKEERPPQR